jgi:acyl-CoA reductase-like NAD-dependent aldehyde dehydrogenase
LWCYLESTVFNDPHLYARVLRQEIVGTVVVIVRYASEEDVLKQAKDTGYVLVAHFWTQNVRRALRLVCMFEATIPLSTVPVASLPMLRMEVGNVGIPLKSCR